MDVRVLLYVFLDKLKCFIVAKEQLLRTEVVYEIQVERMLSHFQVLYLKAIVQFLYFMFHFLQWKLSKIRNVGIT